MAATLGLSAGLVRSADQSYEDVKHRGYDDDINPAKRQRMLREYNAQRAIEKARAVIAARNKEKEKGTTGDGEAHQDFISSKFTTER